jgi:hypothetical protein
MIARISISLLFLTVLSRVMAAQEVPDSLASTDGLSLLTQEHRLLFAYPSELKVLAFRSYDISRELEAMDRAEYPWVDMSDRALDGTSSLHKGSSLGARMTIPLGGRSNGGGTLEGAGRFVLLQALRFGYQFFRESTRRGSLTEFDYLELPQGTGMLRSFQEVQREAQIRGEMQSLRTHEEKREREKNALPEQK